MHRLRLAAFLLFSLGLALPAAAGTVFEDHFDIDAQPGSTLNVDVSFFDLQVSTGRGDAVSVDVFMDVDGGEEQELIDRFKPRYERKGKRIDIVSKSRGKWSWKRTRIKARMTITLPEDIDVKLDTASGDIRFTGRLDGDLNCDTASGDVEIDGSARAMKLDTASGDITMSGAAGRISADTASGDIRVDGLRGKAELDTASGDITAVWDRMAPGSSVKANSASGDIELHLPGDVELDGWADSASGDISSDFRGRFNRDRDHVKFEGGRDSVRIEVDTASGDISIERS